MVVSVMSSWWIQMIQNACYWIWSCTGKRRMCTMYSVLYIESCNHVCVSLVRTHSITPPLTSTHSVDGQQSRVTLLSFHSTFQSILLFCLIWHFVRCFKKIIIVSDTKRTRRQLYKVMLYYYVCGTLATHWVYFWWKVVIC